MGSNRCSDPWGQAVLAEASEALPTSWEDFGEDLKKEEHLISSSASDQSRGYRSPVFDWVNLILLDLKENILPATRRFTENSVIPAINPDSQLFLKTH